MATEITNTYRYSTDTEATRTYVYRQINACDLRAGAEIAIAVDSFADRLHEPTHTVVAESGEVIEVWISPSIFRAERREALARRVATELFTARSIEGSVTVTER